MLDVSLEVDEIKNLVEKNLREVFDEHH